MEPLENVLLVLRTEIAGAVMRSFKTTFMTANFYCFKICYRYWRIITYLGWWGIRPIGKHLYSTVFVHRPHCFGLKPNFLKIDDLRFCSEQGGLNLAPYRVILSENPSGIPFIDVLDDWWMPHQFSSFILTRSFLKYNHDFLQRLYSTKSNGEPVRKCLAYGNSLMSTHWDGSPIISKQLVIFQCWYDRHRWIYIEDSSGL